MKNLQQKNLFWNGTFFKLKKKKKTWNLENEKLFAFSNETRKTFYKIDLLTLIIYLSIYIHANSYVTLMICFLILWKEIYCRHFWRDFFFDFDFWFVIFLFCFQTIFKRRRRKLTLPLTLKKRRRRSLKETNFNIYL